MIASPTPTETIIELDRKHQLLHSGNRWAVRRRRPDGTYDLLEAWSGGRRSLIQWLERNAIHPSREAEAALGRLPETTGFRERA